MGLSCKQTFMTWHDLLVALPLRRANTMTGTHRTKRKLWGRARALSVTVMIFHWLLMLTHVTHGHVLAMCSDYVTAGVGFRFRYLTSERREGQMLVNMLTAPPVSEKWTCCFRYCTDATVQCGPGVFQTADSGEIFKRNIAIEDLKRRWSFQLKEETDIKALFLIM